jgi:aquaporin Z
MKKLNWPAYFAESFGTFVLVLFGCGAAVISGSLIAAAIAFGLVIVAMAYSIGGISGCHINPAVSLAMLLQKKLSLKDFGFYVLFQIIGAFLGSLVLMLILNSNLNLGANAVNENFIGAQGTMGVLVGLLVEVILTFVFIFAILGVTDKAENKLIAGLVIGLTLTLVHILGINLTGTSVNPARSIAPAILQGGIALNQLWIFIVGPLLGSALATCTYRCLTGCPKK